LVRVPFVAARLAAVRRGLAALLLLALLAGAAGAAGRKPHVTLITDSVGASLGWDAAAARIFEHGLDADLELQSCRRLTTASCAVAGSTPPENALETIRRLGRRIGPNVVIDVGYNDYPTVYAPGIALVLRSLDAAGVQHVFWVTLHASRGPYRESNAAIYAAARRHHPQMTVIDWNACSSGHPDWFAADGVHVTGAGAQGLAACMHDAILRVLNAPPPIRVELIFPPGVTAGFRAKLVARGGQAPYRFAVHGLPFGLHATPAGTVSGALGPSGRFVLHVTVRDANGRTVAAIVPLEVSG
jgi:hypothetical protein